MKKSKSKYYICILLAVLIVGLLLLMKYYSKTNQNTTKESALKLEDISNYNNQLEIENFFIGEGDYNICDLEYNYCKNDYFNIKTYSDDAYILENYKYKYIFYVDDDKIKVFNTLENNSYIIDKLSSNYTTDFIIDDNDNFIGVVYTTDLNEHTNYLLVNGNKIIYKQKYDYIQSIGSKYLTANKYDEKGNQIGSYIINANKEEKPLITKKYKTDEYYGFFNLGHKYITFEYDKLLEIYDKDSLKLIYKTTKLNSLNASGNERFKFGVDYLDNIYIYDDGYLSIINNKGKEIKKSNEVINGIDLIDKYVIDTSNDELKIKDIDNKIINIASLKNAKLDYYDFINEYDKKGIYFIVYDKSVTAKEVYDECKEDKCKGISFKDFASEYKNYLGYEYFYDYDSLNVSKKPTFIEHILQDD